MMVQLRNSYKFGILALLGLLVSCKDEYSSKPNLSGKITSDLARDSVLVHSLQNKEKTSIKALKNRSIDTNFKEISQHGLIDIQTINSGIFVDLKYASTDNFMKTRLYDTLTKAYLQTEVAIRLGKCQTYLSTLDPNLHLLIYDAVRPLSVQRKMWNALDTIPVSERSKFVSNPANGSIHNYGAAVDITLCNANGVPLDMGAGYDDIRKIAYPSLESYYLKRGELTKKQIQNRQLLRNVMEMENFRNIPTEWWHFNAFSRNTAKSRFKPFL